MTDDNKTTPTPAPGLDLDAVERAASSFAKYHTEHARFGGASREFHERAETFIGATVPALIAAVRALRAQVCRLVSGQAIESDALCQHHDADLAALAERDEARAEIARLADEQAAARGVTTDVCQYLDCPASNLLAVVTSLYESRVAAVDALAAARAVPGDVEAAMAHAVGCGLDAQAAMVLRAAIARAISDATAAGGTVGGLLAAAPVVEYQVDLGRGPRWRQTRHGRTRTWLGSSPVGMSWTEWSVGSDDVDEYAARLVPADHADADPATRGPMPKGG